MAAVLCGHHNQPSEKEDSDDEGASFLALTTLFVMGVAVGGTVGTAPAYAQSEQTCEQDECDPAPWWQFWTSDQCVMNTGYDTGCDWVGDGECATYSCGQALPGGGGGGNDDDE